jgi:hypothetical protein
MGARPRHERGEPLQQLARLEDDVRGAVAPAVLQPIEEPPVLEPREPLCGDRGPSYIAASCGPGSYADLRDHFVVVFMG